MHEDFRSLLADNGPVAALVSTRITWGLHPQATNSPSIVLTEISATPNYTMAGQDDLVPTRVQVDCRGTTFAEAMGLARAARAALSGFKGTKGTTFFGGVFQTRGGSYSDKPGNVTLHTVSTDFDVWSKPV